MAGSGLNEMRYVIPTEWDYVSIGDYISSSSEKNKQENDFEVYTISNIYGFIKSDEFFDKRVYSRDLSNYKIVRKGYFAYNPYRINVGSLGLYEEDEPGLVSPAYTVFFVDENASLSPEFLFLLLKSNLYRNEIVRYAMSVGSIRRVLAFKDLVAFKIPLPPLPEQRAIAHVLSTVRQAIETTEGVIAATRELKRSMMKHLFTYGTVPVHEADQVPLKETEIGEIPEAWEVLKLGDLVTKKITDGTHQTPTYTNEGIPFITAKDINEGFIDFSDSKYISLEEHEVLTRRVKPERGDILLSKVGTLGNVAQVDTDISFSIFVQLALIKPDSKTVVPSFLKYALLSKKVQSEIIRTSSQSTMKYIGVGKIAKLSIPKPLIEEQERIRYILEIIDNKISSELHQKASLEELFNSLLHYLMTGKIKVNL
jgi:type I restriction enzyme, S subunit